MVCACLGVIRLNRCGTCAIHIIQGDLAVQLVTLRQTSDGVVRALHGRTQAGNRAAHIDALVLRRHSDRCLLDGQRGGLGTEAGVVRILGRHGVGTRGLGQAAVQRGGGAGGGVGVGQAAAGNAGDGGVLVLLSLAVVGQFSIGEVDFVGDVRFARGLVADGERDRFGCEHTADSDADGDGSGNGGICYDQLAALMLTPVGVSSMLHVRETLFRSKLLPT